MMINNLSLEEINDKKKQASLWNSFNDESEGRITFMENEERFRYRKNFEGELLVTNSKKSIKDVVEKMRNKEKKKQSLKEQDANLTIEKSITEFYYNEYCRGYSGSNKKRSQRKQTTLLRTHVIIKKQIIETPLGNVFLRDLNSEILRRHFRMLASEVSYSTLKKVYQTLSIYLDFLDGGSAEEKYHKMLRVDFMPSQYQLPQKEIKRKGVYKYSYGKRTKKERIITKEMLRKHAEKTICALVGSDYEMFKTICNRKNIDIGKFIEGESGYFWGPLIIILAETGMRYSEMAALTWGDIDFKERRIVIKKGYHNISEIPADFSPETKSVRVSYTSTPKTKSSKRVINFSDLVYECLNHYYKKRKTDTDPCFMTTGNKVVSVNQLRKTILKILYEMKVYIDYDEVDKNRNNTIGPHTLRHSYATRRLMDGASPIVIASEMGHENTVMIEEIYVNLSSDIIQQIKKSENY